MGRFRARSCSAGEGDLSARPGHEAGPVMACGCAVAPGAGVDGLIRLTVGWASMVRHPVQVAGLAPGETIRSRDPVTAVDVTVILASMVVALTALTALKVTPVAEAVTLGAVAGGTAHPLPEITTANDPAPWPMAWGDGERSRRRARFAEGP